MLLDLLEELLNLISTRGLHPKTFFNLERERDRRREWQRERERDDERERERRREPCLNNYLMNQTN